MAKSPAWPLRRARMTSKPLIVEYAVFSVLKPRTGRISSLGVRRSSTPRSATSAGPASAPVLFVLRVLRPLRWFGLVECRGEDATRTGHGERRKTPLFDRFVQFDPELAGIGTATLH